MVSSAECVLLKEELQTAKDKIVLYEDSSNNELVISLQNEVKEAQVNLLFLFYKFNHFFFKF